MQKTCAGMLVRRCRGMAWFVHTAWLSVVSRSRFSLAWEGASVRAVGMRALTQEKKTGVARRREGHALGLVMRGARPVGVGPSCKNDPDTGLVGHAFWALVWSCCWAVNWA